MKKFTISLAIALIISLFLTTYEAACEVETMTDKFVRVHILADSDSDTAQRIKLNVRDRVLEAAKPYLSGVSTKEKAMNTIYNILPKLRAVADKALSDNGAGYCASVSLKKEYFDKRVYDGFTLPAGIYDSLVIKLGRGAGKNWWCLCYPDVCVSASTKLDDTAILTDGEIKILKSPVKVRCKLFCYEVYLRIKRMFGK